MAKKISKFTIGEIVKTFGGKTLRKLTPEGGLPVWDGTDLTGTIWVLKGDWTTDGSIGAVSINGVFLLGNSSYSTGRINFSEMEFQQGKIIFRNDVGSESISDYYSSDRTIKLIGGEGATNPLLIAFFKQYGELTSYQTPEVTFISFTLDGKGYQAEEGMTWADWVASEYNTGRYRADGYYVSDEYSNPIENSADVWQYPTDYIIANESYNATSGSHSGGMN